MLPRHGSVPSLGRSVSTDRRRLAKNSRIVLHRRMAANLRQPMSAEVVTKRTSLKLKLPPKRTV